MKKALPSQKARVVEILTESFGENKGVNYVVKQDSNRKSRLRGLMDYCYTVCDAFGEVWISEDEQTCALILHLDKKRISFRAIWWDLKLAISVIGLSRVNQVMTQIHQGPTSIFVILSHEGYQFSCGFFPAEWSNR